MADAGVPKGFARSEVRLLVRDDARVLVSRMLGQRAMILVLSCLALLALVVPALDLRLDTVVLRCSRREAACTVAGGEVGAATIALDSIVEFAAVHPRKQKPDLLARTESGELVLVHRWPHEELRAHAAALNALLREDRGPGEWTFTYRRSLQALREDLPIFGSLFALMVVLVVMQLGWRTRLERRERRVIRWKPLSRAVRPIDVFRAVLVRSMAEAHPAQTAGRAPQANAMLEAHLQIALIEADGAAWPVTRFVTCPREEVEARAAEVAAYLGLPVARAPERDPPSRAPAGEPASS